MLQFLHRRDHDSLGLIADVHVYFDYRPKRKNKQTEISLDVDRRALPDTFPEGQLAQNLADVTNAASQAAPTGLPQSTSMTSPHMQVQRTSEWPVRKKGPTNSPVCSGFKLCIYLRYFQQDARARAGADMEYQLGLWRLPTSSQSLLGQRNPLSCTQEFWKLCDNYSWTYFSSLKHGFMQTVKKKSDF